MRAYFEASGVSLYHGDCREVLPLLDVAADCVIADPPYAQTSLAWDRWPERWPSVVVASVLSTGSMWCFGSLRMFMLRAAEFAERWQFAQDVVWEKHNGSNFHADRFKRVHDQAAQFYRFGSPWNGVYKNPVYTHDAVRRTVRRKKRRPTHTGSIGAAAYASEDGGPRLERSVIYERSTHGYAENETQKPLGLTLTLIEYSCPRGGLVLSPFAGSGTDLVAARMSGRRAIGIETREEQCEIAARRVMQTMPLATKERTA